MRSTASVFLLGFETFRYEANEEATNVETEPPSRQQFVNASTGKCTVFSISSAISQPAAGFSNLVEQINARGRTTIWVQARCRAVSAIDEMSVIVSSSKEHLIAIKVKVRG